MTTLSPEEVADFWAAGISVEARFLPADEWQRAIAEDRALAAQCFSSMGTKETGWHHANTGTDPRECIVVAPGQVAKATEWEDLRDDGNVIAVCWEPFWDKQRDTALAAIPARHHAAFLEHCAHMLVELERQYGQQHSQHRALFLDLLISADKLDPAALEKALAGKTSPKHLSSGVRARWITRKLDVMFNAVMTSAERAAPKDHGQRVVRTQVLRFAAKLARDR